MYANTNVVFTYWFHSAGLLSLKHAQLQQLLMYMCSFHMLISFDFIQNHVTGLPVCCSSHTHSFMYMYMYMYMYYFHLLATYLGLYSTLTRHKNI